MPPEPTQLDNHLKEINEELYKRNFELAIKNKTLSLLEELYKISILSLDPAPLAERITTTIQKALESTLVGIFTQNESGGYVLTACAVDSDMQAILDKHQAKIIGSTVDDIHEDQDFALLTTGALTQEDALAIQSEAGISASFIHKLTIDQHGVGAIWICLNRPYDTLSLFEQQAMSNLVNVVALALDRSFIYQQITLANTKLHDANEKLKDLDASKNEFLSFATHQLRSPLTSLKWGLDVIVDTLKEYRAKPDEIKTADHLRTTANDMVRTVEDLLNISKIEQGGFVMNPEDFDVVEFMDQLAEEFRITAQKKELSLTFHADEPIVIINGDRTKLRQVVVNIIDNSIKYTQTGNIRVTLHRENNDCVIMVTDTGPGIAPEELVKLFNKFGRGDAGRSSQGGSGLGLYLAKKIMELHHGNVEARSEGIGKGSSFTIKLPIQG